MMFPRISARAHLGLSLLWALVFSVPADASYVSAASGTWGVTQRSKFAIAGFGTHSVSGDGNCIVAVRDSFNAGLSCKGFDDSLGQTYSGGLNAVIRRKTLSWRLDEAGLEQVKANMTRWLIGQQLKKGRTLEPGNIRYEFDTSKYKPVRLSRGLTQPVLAQGVLKGRAVQLVNGRYIVRRFTYEIKIKFLAPAP